MVQSATARDSHAWPAHAVEACRNSADVQTAKLRICCRFREMKGTRGYAALDW